MRKRSIIILMCCFSLAILIVMVLYGSSKKLIHEQNSFLRIYEKRALIKGNRLDIKYNSYYLAGLTADNIYLGNYTTPFHLMVINTGLTDTQQVSLTIEGTQAIPKSTLLKIDPPYFYMADGRTPAVYRGEIGKWEAERFSYSNKAYFTRLIPLGDGSFAIRTNASRSSDNVLGKVRSGVDGVKLNASLLEKQVDGVFCTDGLLLYNSDLRRLIYTYYYRNQFVVYDTSLNLDYRGTTIDTFSRAQIRVGYIQSEKSRQLLESKHVNLHSCTSGKYLFVKSNLLAKNDFEDRLRYESVIDIYDLTNNTYRFSVALPNFDPKNPIRDFMVLDNKMLVALYDHYIIKYDMQPQFFDPPQLGLSNRDLLVK